MKTLKNYDEALLKFYKKQQLNCLPLISWEFYCAKFYNENKLNKEVTLLNSLAVVWKNKWNFKNHLKQNTTIIVTDTLVKIVYASSNIEEMTGYKPHELLGKSPKIFQGEKTNSDILKSFKIAIKNKKPFHSTLVNYKKDGSEYNCEIKAYPVFNSKNKLVNFIAFEKAV
ncbi:PAS domain-containing protein [Abyssalbus ytuae]|uniref:PAS domain-containing protein n=1 Tax=Abyssalbus ytuae TaxID=2926907 RepID=A0A9E6ZRJ4_9FLAO|nr:PAS domain-containing protein [Abyssalbus ytuae]UOB19245.1 PAS domain-containing protein [Abyssalbus ytuae]